MESYYLQPNYDTRNSFYDKARVEIDGDIKILYSYETKVSYIKDLDNGEFEVVVLGVWGDTTTRHIKEFLLQNGFEVGSGKKMFEIHKKE
jgi:hypothetical protein